LHTQSITAQPEAFIGDEIAGCAFAFLQRNGAHAMVRRRFIASPKDLLAAFAKDAIQKASDLPPCPEREELLKRARRADTAAHIDEWINSPGLRSPK
jgi:hypothetical protein